ncbi:MAG: GntR family transcriptional regulator [Clostridia bacterium]|nr:GntR family transcriptional regulator [Clostridia bacterium]
MKQTLESTVFDRLEAEILDGTVPAGTTLSEIKICEMYGVSRTPVREAVLLLEREGLVISSGMRGITVVGVDDADIDDIYQIRIRTEGLASRYMAERPSAAERRELAEAVALQEFYTGRGDAKKLRELDTRFHEIVYRGSGSRVIEGTLSGLHKQISLFRERAFLSPERTPQSVAEHKEILNAIMQNDGDAAEALTAEHIKNAYKFLTEMRKSK